MGKKLVIVESPTKAKTIGRYLGKDYKISASVGHIRDLPRNSMGVNVNDNFKPIYITTNVKVVKELKDLASDADMIGFICPVYEWDIPETMKESHDDEMQPYPGFLLRAAARDAAA